MRPPAAKEVDLSSLRSNIPLPFVSQVTLPKRWGTFRKVVIKEGPAVLQALPRRQGKQLVFLQRIRYWIKERVEVTLFPVSLFFRGREEKGTYEWRWNRRVQKEENVFASFCSIVTCKLQLNGRRGGGSLSDDEPATNTLKVAIWWAISIEHWRGRVNNLFR